MPEGSKPRSTKTGLIWSFIDNISQQVVNFVVGIVLARLLVPEEFGLVGIVSVFFIVLNTFVDGGLSDAVINKKNAIARDFNTVFWANLVFSIFIYLVLYLSAPFIAAYFQQEELTFLLRLGGVYHILFAFSSVQRCILVKDVNFKRISFISLVAVSVSGIIAIVMAFQGYGVISLLARFLLGEIISIILFWVLSSWKPSVSFSVQSFLELYKYGVNIFLSKFLNTLQNNLFPFLIGKTYSPVVLGYYSRAETFRNLLSSNISMTIQRVSFSVLSKLEDRGEIVRMYNRFIILTILLSSFGMTYLYVNADSIVLILLGDKWVESILYLKIIAISGLFLPIYNLNLNLLAVIRETSIFLRIEVISKILLVPLIFIAFNVNIIHFLWTIVVYSFAIYLISFFVVRRYFNKSIDAQVYLVLKTAIPIVLLILTLPLFDSVENIYGRFLVLSIFVCLVFGIFIQIVYPRLYIDVKNLFSNRN